MLFRSGPDQDPPRPPGIRRNRPAAALLLLEYALACPSSSLQTAGRFRSYQSPQHKCPQILNLPLTYVSQPTGALLADDPLGALKRIAPPRRTSPEPGNEITACEIAGQRISGDAVAKITGFPPDSAPGSIDSWFLDRVPAARSRPVKEISPGLKPFAVWVRSYQWPMCAAIRRDVRHGGWMETVRES